MDRSYDQVMEHIIVTPEMRRRILRNLQGMDLQAVKPARVTSFPIRRLAALAACLAVVLAGVWTLPRLMTPAHPRPSPGLLITNGIVEAATQEALSAAVGFPVEGLSSLPFVPEETQYASISGLAQIRYVSAAQQATYRKGIGTGDVSGDYGAYPQTQRADAAGVEVTLKGGDGRFSLATWTDGTYAYSISLSEGMEKNDLLSMIPATD